MLTLASIMKAQQQATAYGETGRHVHGRGTQRIDGTFSDEKKKPQQKPAAPAPKTELKP